MKIKIMQIPITEEEYHKLIDAATALERQKPAPKARPCVADFVREAAVSQAETIIAVRNS